MQQRQLERRGLDYQPDLVLLGFVPNDVEPDIYTEKPKVEFLTEFTAAYVEVDWLSQYSELWMLARRKVLRQAAGQRYLQHSIDSFLNEPEKWDTCRTALEGIRDRCKTNGIRFAVVIFPFFIRLNGDYPFQPIHDHVRTFCEDAGIPVLDLRETYRGFDGPELWVHPTDQHPNEQAHNIAGGAIVRFLTESGLIADKRYANGTAK